MNDTQSYERLIKKKTEGKLLLAKIGLIACYTLFAIIGVLLAVLLADGHPALLLLVAVLDFCLWLFTWKLSNIEYEYAFISGTFYLSKIFGKANRREVFESELSRAVTVAPYSGQYKLDAEKQEPKRIIPAISSKKAEDVWFILFESEGGTRTLVLFEADERSLRCLRHGCPRAIAREKLTKTQPATEENDNA